MIQVTLREDVLKLLEEGPWTATGLSKRLQRDKSQVRKLLLIMERQGLVACQAKRKGDVAYKFWRLQPE